MKKHSPEEMRKAWEEFSESGAVGAYLMYRAMLDAEDND